MDILVLENRGSSASEDLISSFGRIDLQKCSTNWSDCSEDISEVILVWNMD